jgi:hypothetical protein
MQKAHNRQAISAKITESGSAPPAKAAPAGIEAAMAAPGAMSVMLWNSTSRRPMASLRRPGGAAADDVAVMPPPVRCAAKANGT